MAFLNNPASLSIKRLSAGASNWNLTLLLVLFWSTLLTSCKVADSGVSPNCSQSCLVKKYRMDVRSRIFPRSREMGGYVYTYDANCQLTKIEGLDSLGNIISGNNYTYTGRSGNQYSALTQTQSNGNSTITIDFLTYTWSGNNIIKTAYNPLMYGTYEFLRTYDANDNMLTSTVQIMSPGSSSGITKYEFAQYTNGRPRRIKTKSWDDTNRPTDSSFAYCEYDANMNLVKRAYYTNNDTTLVYRYESYTPSTYQWPAFVASPLPVISVNPSPGNRDHDTHIPAKIEYFYVDCFSTRIGPFFKYMEEVNTFTSTNSSGCLNGYTRTVTINPNACFIFSENSTSVYEFGY